MGKVTLTGMIQMNNEYIQAKTQDSEDVLFFIGNYGDKNEYFHMERFNDYWKLSTPNGVYKLTKKTKTKYTVMCPGNKVVTWCPKKIVGHLSW